MGNGITFAVFQIVGITLSHNELLQSAINGSSTGVSLSIKTDAGVLSGPIDLFNLIRSKAISVTQTLIIYSAGISP